MTGYRIAVLALLVVVTACMACSHVFPLFRVSHHYQDSGVLRTYTYYYWYRQGVERLEGGEWVISRLYTRDVPCGKMRGHFISASASAFVATVLGGVATLLSAAWVSMGYSELVSVLIFVLTFVAFVYSCIVVGLMSAAYHQDFYVHDFRVTVLSPSSTGYEVAEGFRLLCVAAAGFLFLFVMQLIDFWYGYQRMPRGERDEQQQLMKDLADCDDGRASDCE